MRSLHARLPAIPGTGASTAALSSLPWMSHMEMTLWLQRHCAPKHSMMHTEESAGPAHRRRARPWWGSQPAARSPPCLLDRALLCQWLQAVMSTTTANITANWELGPMKCEMCATHSRAASCQDTSSHAWQGAARVRRADPQDAMSPRHSPGPFSALSTHGAHETVRSAPAPPWCTTAVQRGKSQSCGTSPTIRTPEGMSPASTAPRPPHPAACTPCRVGGLPAAVTCLAAQPCKKMLRPRYRPPQRGRPCLWQPRANPGSPPRMCTRTGPAKLQKHAVRRHRAPPQASLCG